MIARRTLPVSCINDLHHLYQMNYPMLDNFIPVMLEHGIYQLKDDASGRILSAQEALGVLEKGKENDN